MESTTGEIFLCIKQFNARLGDELNLNPGDKVEVLADDSEYNDGWYMGKHLTTGEVGLYPKSFTEMLQSQRPGNASLLRSRSRRISNKVSSSPSTPTNLNPNMSNLSDSFEKLNTSNRSTPRHVNSTMRDIDIALSELQNESKTRNEAEVPPIKTASSAASYTPEPVALQSRNGALNKKHMKSDSVKSFSDDLNPLKVFEWTPKQVYSYFTLVSGFDVHIADKFLEHKITGEILLQLDLAHLKELDIDSFGTRFEVNKEIEKLREISSRAVMKRTPKLSNAPQQPTMVSNTSGANNIDAVEREPQLLPSVDVRRRSVDSPDVSNSLHSPTLHELVNKDKHVETTKKSTILASSAKQSSGEVPQSRPSSSVYEQSVSSHQRNASLVSKDMTHKRNSSLMSNSGKRRSSLFLFFSGNETEKLSPLKPNDAKEPSPASPISKRTSRIISGRTESPIASSSIDSSARIVPGKDTGKDSPKKSKSISYERLPERTEKRSVSDTTASRPKGLKSTPSQNFRNLGNSRKLKTSAFQEGIRDITPYDATNTADYSGWMAKKSGSSLGWRSRYFTLHGTRLSYFGSMKDKREKGLIDITAHKVIPVNTDGDFSATDKYVALYASSAGLGRYCFKLVPPAPGFKKGLTFTQPRIHYFAVESKEEMRAWLKALMTATIDLDDTVPVVSSYTTPTVSLSKAQELLAKARLETKIKDDELKEKGYFKDGNDENYLLHQFSADSFDGQTSADTTASPNIDSIDDTTVSSVNNQGHPNFHSNGAMPTQPKLSIDTGNVARSPSTPQTNGQNGFSSPYLLASGLLSPRSAHSSSAISQPSPTIDGNNSFETENSAQPETKSPRSIFANSMGRVLNKKKNRSEKTLSYMADASGNPAFVFKKN